MQHSVHCFPLFFFTLNLHKLEFCEQIMGMGVYIPLLRYLCLFIFVAKSFMVRSMTFTVPSNLVVI